MQILMTLFIAVLFFALTPNTLVSIPAHGSKYVVALTHALVFALIYHLAHNTTVEFGKNINQDIQRGGYRLLSYKFKLPGIVL